MTPKRAHAKIMSTKVGVSQTRAVERILAAFDQATPEQIEAGVFWYSEAMSIVMDLSEKSGKSQALCATVIAHLSPRTTWGRNVAGAYGLLLHGTAMHCMAANVRNARRAIEADKDLINPERTLRGPKVTAFARNILGDRDAVTIDVWAMAVIMNTKNYNQGILSRVGVYDAAAHCYTLAAAQRNVDPATVQAVCWIVAKSGALFPRRSS